MLQLWDSSGMDAPPSNWAQARFSDSTWPAATELFQLGSGPWGGGHNANFPPTSQWMWSSESVSHNDIFCRIVIPCGSVNRALLSTIMLEAHSRRPS